MDTILFVDPITDAGKEGLRILANFTESVGYAVSRQTTSDGGINIYISAVEEIFQELRIRYPQLIVEVYGNNRSSDVLPTNKWKFIEFASLEELVEFKLRYG